MKVLQMSDQVHYIWRKRENCLLWQKYRSWAFTKSWSRALYISYFFWNFMVQ